ncbi:peptide ABC transporter substrate-binding protein [Brochothrix campestris]|uniref:peptide ABC transporter substrate-binding protein n=1 Tax=Brochothrix campestris TaxID=2757 RepID=UPI0038D1353C
MTKTSIRKKALVGSSIVMTAVLLGACGNSSANESNSSKTASKIKLSAQSNIAMMDSRVASDETSIQALNQTNEGLYSYNLDGKLVPAIAEKTTTNKAKTVYTFKLREDAEWSNGEKVTAADFEYAWKSAVDPKTASTYTYLFDGVVKNASDIIAGKKKNSELGVEATAADTLKVTLERPVPYFDTLLSFSVFFPLNEKFVTAQGEKYAQDSDRILYNGPYVMKDWKQASDSWTLTKNTKYWDEKNVKTKTFVYHLLENSGTGANLFETGEIDRVLLTGDYAKQYKTNDNFVKRTGSFVYYIKFNQTKNTAVTGLDNLNLRKALKAAIDTKSLTEHVLSNGSIPAEGFIPKDFVANPDTGKDFREDAGAVTAYDVAAAKKYYAKAKAETGKDSFTLELLNDDTDGSKPTAEYIQNQWQTNLPGVKVEIKTVPKTSRLELNTKKDYETQLTAWGPGYQDLTTYLDTLKSDAVSNSMGYNDKAYDELITKAAVDYGTEPLKRWNTFIEAEKLAVQEDAALAPLYQNALASLENPQLKNFKRYPYALTALKYVYLEK